MFTSSKILSMGDYAIPLIGVLGVIISSVLNYVTGSVHFFSVFREVPYIKKWLPFYFFAFMLLGKQTNTLIIN